MSIFKLLFQLFLLYMAYKVIFHFIIPVYRTTKRMKKGMSEMQQKMEEAQKRQNQQETAAAAKPKAPVAGDYIDYEEVR